MAGSFGIGKTLAVTNILKQALAKGYSSLYVTLEDIITAVRSKAYFEARQELLTINFLVIDELDPRYMATDASADFHGRLLESVLRHRTGNKLPLFLCTNTISPTTNPKMEFEPKHLVWFRHDMLAKKLVDAFPSLKPEGHAIYSSLLKKLGIQHEIKYEQPQQPVTSSNQTTGSI